MAFKNEFRTTSRNEIIDLATKLALIARLAFEKAPTRTHIVKVDGDLMSGKSLIIDTMHAQLFGNEGIGPPKQRVMWHYAGKIADKSATITFANIGSDISGLLPRAVWLTRPRPGFIFLSNHAPINLLGWAPFIRLELPLMKINVSFPETEHQSFAFRHLGWKAHKPETEERIISVEGAPAAILEL